MSGPTTGNPESRVYQKILVVAAAMFIILPFVTTFNEFLTKVVEGLNFVVYIQGILAPFIVRVVAFLLKLLGLSVAIDGSYLFIMDGWMPFRIYLNWNCIGWQSLILLAFTFVTGLQGPYTLRSKLMAVAFALEGTFLMNIVRILVPTLLAFLWGYVPAIIFHDYFGTVFTLLWMGLFWNYAFGNILVRREDTPETNEDPNLKESIRDYINDLKGGRP